MKPINVINFIIIQGAINVNETENSNTAVKCDAIKYTSLLDAYENSGEIETSPKSCENAASLLLSQITVGVVNQKALLDCYGNNCLSLVIAAIKYTTLYHASTLNALTELESADDITGKCMRLNMILKSYGIDAEPIDAGLVQRAARFLRFKLVLKPGERINNLKKKREDIARELEAFGEISIDNIKGTRYVGLDVPFSDVGEPLSLSDNIYRLSESEGRLSILAGQQPDGEYQYISHLFFLVLLYAADAEIY